MKLSVVLLVVVCVALASAANSGPGKKERKAPKSLSRKAPGQQARSATNYLDAGEDIKIFYSF